MATQDIIGRCHGAVMINFKTDYTDNNFLNAFERENDHFS